MKQTRFSRGAPVIAAALALAVAALTASAISAQPTETGSAAAWPQTPQAVADHVLGSHVPVSTLGPIIGDAFRVAAKPPSAAMQKLALTCWKENVCSTGHGKYTIAIVDGADNTWRRITKMETILQALSYPDVAKIIYTNAGGDLTRAQTDLESLISQGVDAIVGYFDFGAATYPQMRKAIQAGIPVVPYIGGFFGAKPGQEYTTRVEANLCTIGRDMAEAAAKATGGKGNVVYMTGTPGNPQGQAWQGCASSVFKQKYPGIKVVDKADTNWSQEGAYKAAAAALGRTQVDAYLYDYATASRGIVRAYQQAGKPVPAIITWTQDNELFGSWDKLSPKEPTFKIYFNSNINFPGRIAVTAALDALKKERVPPLINYKVPFTQLKKGVYDAKKPADWGSTMLVPDSLFTSMLAAK